MTEAGSHPETNIEDEPALSVNLETRKKRRESGPRLSGRRVSLFESPEESDEVAPKPSRPATKRKFSVQEDEDKVQVSGDLFQFSRRGAAGASDSEAANEESRPSSPERPILSASESISDASLPRKLTYSEPVNTDPVISPKKQRPSVQEKSEKPEKKSQPPSKPRGRPRLNITRNDAPMEIPHLPMPEPVLSADIVLESLPPKTPAVEDSFSPPSTEPSTQRPENKDTPPPNNLSSNDQTGQAGRPGRRARPQVSYKEPSLNSKMRRPDAKLVDAIVDRRVSVEPQTAPSTVKSEPTPGLAWKPVSAVSAGTREEEAEAGSPLRQKLDRKEISLEIKTSPHSVEVEERSTASKAIATLLDQTSTVSRKAASATSARPEAHVDPSSINVQEPKKSESKGKDGLAVYEITDSPPVDTATNPRSRISELAKASRNARRHSAMPGANTEDRKAEKAEGALTSLHKRTGSGSIKSSNTPNLTKSASTVTPRTTLKDRRTVAASGSVDIKANTEGEESAPKPRETIALRAERAASRRKSMML